MPPPPRGIREFGRTDTVCIDKSSSAELSEAINSMYRWYQNAQICYAYLADVTVAEKPRGGGSAFERSRWFTRGWTLQELIAPSNLVFYSSDWRRIGTKSELRDIISEITGINVGVLGGTDPDHFSIAQRMSWASKRKTTRVEDIAYCLLGIFGVNMTLLYGEGERSFVRLQEEIMKASDDHSLFAWAMGNTDPETGQGLLATSPEEFRNSGSIVSGHDWTLSSLPYAMTNRGLRITLSLARTTERNIYTASLNCLGNDHTPVIFLRRLSSAGDQYVRVRTPRNKPDLSNTYRKVTIQTIYVRQKMPVPGPESLPQHQEFSILTEPSVSKGGYDFSNIDTPTRSISVNNHNQIGTLSIPKGSDGWIGALLFKDKHLETRGGFCVLLGFTPDLGVSIRIAMFENQDSKDLFRRYDPREPSVLEHFLVRETGSPLYIGRRRLYTNLQLQWSAGKKIYIVRIGME